MDKEHLIHQRNTCFLRYAFEILKDEKGEDAVISFLEKSKINSKMVDYLYSSNSWISYDYEIRFFEHWIQNFKNDFRYFRKIGKRSLNTLSKKSNQFLDLKIRIVPLKLIFSQLNENERLFSQISSVSTRLFFDTKKNINKAFLRWRFDKYQNEKIQPHASTIEIIHGMIEEILIKKDLFYHKDCDIKIISNPCHIYDFPEWEGINYTQKINSIYDSSGNTISASKTKYIIDNTKFNKSALTLLVQWPQELTLFKKIFGGVSHKIEFFREKEEQYRKLLADRENALQKIKAELHAKDIKLKNKEDIINENILIQKKFRNRLLSNDRVNWNGIRYGVINLFGSKIEDFQDVAYTNKYIFTLLVSIPGLGSQESHILFSLKQSFQIYVQYIDNIEKLWDKLLSGLSSQISGFHHYHLVLIKLDAKNNFHMKSANWNGIYLLKNNEERTLKVLVNNYDKKSIMVNNSFNITGKLKPGDKLILFSRGLILNNYTQNGKRGSFLFKKSIKNKALLPIGIFLNDLKNELLCGMEEVPEKDTTICTIEIHPMWNKFIQQVKAGLLLKKQGKIQAALEKLQNAYNIIPFFPKLLYLLSRLYAEQKNYVEVAKYLEEYCRFCPNDNSSLYNLSLSYKLSNNNKEALKYADLLRKKDKSNADYLLLYLNLIQSMPESRNSLQIVDTYQKRFGKNQKLESFVTNIS